MTTTDDVDTYCFADFGFSLAPANYDLQKNFFDAFAIEATINFEMFINSEASWSSSPQFLLDILGISGEKW